MFAGDWCQTVTGSLSAPDQTYNLYSSQEFDTISRPRCFRLSITAALRAVPIHLTWSFV